MGKKSKKKAGRSGNGTTHTRTRQQKAAHRDRTDAPAKRTLFDSSNVLAQEEKLLALIAQGRISSPCEAYLQLACAHAESNEHGSNDKAESYLDKIVSTNDDERGYLGPSESARAFLAYLKIEKCSSAMGVYHSQQLKEHLSMEKILTAMEFMHIDEYQVDEEEDDDYDKNCHDAIQILEDHLSAVGDIPMDVKETCEFYQNLGVAYCKTKEYRKACGCFKKQLQVAENLGKLYMRYRATSEVANTYDKMGKYTTSLQHYERCLDLLTTIVNDGTYESGRTRIKMERVSVLVIMAKMIKVEAIRVKGRFRRDDAKRALKMCIEAYKLAEEVVLESDSNSLDVMESFFESSLGAGMMSGDVGDYNNAILYADQNMGFLTKRNKLFRETEEDMPPKMKRWMIETSLLSSQVFLQAFHYYKYSCGQQWGVRKYLHDAKRCIRHLAGSSCVPSAFLAQVHFFLGETDEAYRQLALYLDTQILRGLAPLCSVCFEKKDTVSNSCSHCNSVHYCSKACQKYHWKNGVHFCGMACQKYKFSKGNHFGVSHKVICPLLAYWRRKWKNELKTKSYSEDDIIRKRWRDVDMTNGLLSEECRAMFKDFYDNLESEKEKEHKASVVPDS